MALEEELAAEVIAAEDELTSAELVAVELTTLLALLDGAGLEPPPPQAVSPRLIRDRVKIR